MTAFFEDLAIGDTMVLGSFTFTAEDIIRFARNYDPQPFHLSEEAAAKTHFGRLCASGWHTASVFMKLMVAKTNELREQAESGGIQFPEFGPSPGFKNLKWSKPVFAGDTLTYEWTVSGKTESKSRPEWGLIHFENLARNQDGERVFSFDGTVFTPRRPA